MKKIILIIIILTGFLIFGQSSNPEIKAELPNVIPPSPTVAALMKFEEVPVSNYTGLPDITVPLFSEDLHDKLKLNLTLKYHPYGVKLKEIASDVGLGWSLTGLGSISRSVVGYPDEIYDPEKKIGVYRNYPSASSANVNYYNALNVINGTSNNLELYQEFAFDATAKSIYDHKHDVWQYNFFGNSGRFIIQKNQFGVLEVVSLDNNNLKIINHYITPASSQNPQLHYQPTGFTIIDENGYKFDFDVFETTFVTSNSNQINFYNSGESMNIITQNDLFYHFKSAFHLTKVSYNNIDLLTIDYQAATNEHIIDSSIINNYSSGNIAQVEQYYTNNYAYFTFLQSLYLPQQISSSNTKSYVTKKVNTVQLIGKGIIPPNVRTEIIKN